MLGRLAAGSVTASDQYSDFVVLGDVLAGRRTLGGGERQGCGC
jgi:hypothetical protein